MHKWVCRQQGQKTTVSLCYNPVALSLVWAFLWRSLGWVARSLPSSLLPGNTMSRSHSQAEQRSQIPLIRTKRPHPGASPDYFLYPRPSGDFLNPARSCLPPQRWCGSALGCQGNRWAALYNEGKWGRQTGRGRGVLCLGPMSQELEDRKLAMLKDWFLKQRLACAILLFQPLNRK